jgi:isopenicillin-N epimerase
LYCTKSKAIYKRQHITLPITTNEKLIEDFFAGLADRTKVVFISHITSSTGLILPVKEIVDFAREKGIITIVDGAHVPGQLPLSINELDADFYTGAAHKWMMAAKGCSFLYAHKRVQHLLKEPLIVSWGYKAIKPSGSNFIDYNQMIGTRDFSAFLTIPSCIAFMEENNWQSVAKQCHELVLSNAERFYTLLESSPISPLTSEWIGQMLSIPIQTAKPEELQRRLFTHYKIEIPVFRQGNNIYLRYSINGFNSQEDLDALYDAMVEIKNEGDLLSI